MVNCDVVGPANAFSNKQDQETPRNIEMIDENRKMKFE